MHVTVRSTNNPMKQERTSCCNSLITLFLFTAAALFPLCALAESFTEGKRVPPTTEKLKIGDFVWEPERAPAGPVLIVVSVPDKVVYVYRNGVEIGRSSVRTIEIKGLHIFSALAGRDDQGRSKWIRVDGKPAANDPNIAEMASKAGIADAFITGVREVVIPGTTLVFTDQPVNTNTQSKPGFKILLPGQVTQAEWNVSPLGSCPALLAVGLLAP